MRTVAHWTFFDLPGELANKFIRSLLNIALYCIFHNEHSCEMNTYVYVMFIPLNWKHRSGKVEHKSKLGIVIAIFHIKKKV